MSASHSLLRRNSSVVRLPWRGSRWNEVSRALAEAPASNADELTELLGVTSGDPFSEGRGWFARGGLRADDVSQHEKKLLGAGGSMSLQEQLQRVRGSRQACMSDERFYGCVLPFMRQQALALPAIIDERGGDIAVLQPMVDAVVALPRNIIYGLLCHMFFCTFDAMGEFPSAETVSEPAANNMEGIDAVERWAYNGFTARNILNGLGAPLRCLLHYFDRCAPASPGETDRIPPGDIIFHRQVLPVPTRRAAEIADHWEQSSRPLVPVHVTVDSIEDQVVMPAGDQVQGDAGVADDSTRVPAWTHADFANEYIGGGVLTGGNVQEEILFVIKPECLVSLLLAPRMEALPLSEAVILTGCEQFSKYTGYGHTFQWAGPHDDSACPRVVAGENLPWAAGTLKRHIYAIDATIAWGGTSQFGGMPFVRDVLKAQVGCAVTQPAKLHHVAANDVFVRDPSETGPVGVIQVGGDESLSVRPLPIPWSARWSMLDVDPREERADAVVTGNWGCGAFGGDKELKAVQQIISASLSDRPGMVYSSFKDERFRDRLQEFCDWLRDAKISVGELVKQVRNFADDPHPYRTIGLFDYIKRYEFGQEQHTGLEEHTTSQTLTDFDQHSSNSKEH